MLPAISADDFDRALKVVGSADQQVRRPAALRVQAKLSRAGAGPPPPTEQPRRVRRVVVSSGERIAAREVRSRSVSRGAPASQSRWSGRSNCRRR